MQLTLTIAVSNVDCERSLSALNHQFYTVSTLYKHSLNYAVIINLDLYYISTLTMHESVSTQRNYTAGTTTVI